VTNNGALAFNRTDKRHFSSGVISSAGFPHPGRHGHAYPHRRQHLYRRHHRLSRHSCQAPPPACKGDNRRQRHRQRHLQPRAATGTYAGVISGTGSLTKSRYRHRSCSPVTNTYSGGTHHLGRHAAGRQWRHPPAPSPAMSPIPQRWPSNRSDNTSPSAGVILGNRPGIVHQGRNRHAHAYRKPTPTPAPQTVSGGRTQYPEQHCTRQRPAGGTDDSQRRCAGAPGRHITVGGGGSHPLRHRHPPMAVPCAMSSPGQQHLRRRHPRWAVPVAIKRRLRHAQPDRQTSAGAAQKPHYWRLPAIYHPCRASSAPPRLAHQGRRRHTDAEAAPNTYSGGTTVSGGVPVRHHHQPAGRHHRQRQCHLQPGRAAEPMPASSLRYRLAHQGTGVGHPDAERAPTPTPAAPHRLGRRPVGHHPPACRATSPTNANVTFSQGRQRHLLRASSPAPAR